MNDLLEATRSILKVGDGRGFVVNGERDRLPEAVDRKCGDIVCGEAMRALQFEHGLDRRLRAG